MSCSAPDALSWAGTRSTIGTVSNRKRLLIVAHAPSDNTRRLFDAVVGGAQSPTIDNVEVIARSPFDAGPDDVLAAQAVILGTTENLGYMSGALKDFFDRIYSPCLDKTEGLPYALYIRAGHDGTGTRRGIEYRLGIDAVGPIEVGNVCRLAECFDTQRIDPMSGDGANPGQRGRMCIDYSDQCRVW